jgi:nucleotide-binding universal stress UspA family protein
VYENILLPTDGSDGTGRVVEHAIHVARLDGATLHVLHVVDTSVVALDAHSRSVYDGMEAAGRNSVEEIRDRALEVGIHSVSAVRRGTPHREILDYAAENAVDLVVMGTHGRTGLQHTLLGSVTERVVRLSEVPVLTVRTRPASEV